MNAWIILLFLLAGNNCGCGWMNDGRDCDRDRDRDRDGDCGCDRDRDRDRDCGCDRDRDRDRDCDRDRFEPRFDTRPFNDRDRETCGCEENCN